MSIRFDCDVYNFYLDSIKHIQKTFHNRGREDKSYHPEMWSAILCMDLNLEIQCSVLCRYDELLSIEAFIGTYTLSEIK